MYDFFCPNHNASPNVIGVNPDFAISLIINNRKDKYIIAWFTPELPFNFGPKYYNGLPGLIIKLKEGKRITYTLKEIERVNNQKISFQKKGKEITSSELRVMAGEMLKNRRN